jgi:hypothetical protein
MTITTLEKEGLLLELLEMTPNYNARALMVQTYIHNEGPLTEANAKKVRALLAGGNAPYGQEPL